MNWFLQVVGSLASIASIPLAVFLYLRQREAKYRRLRQEIARTLSYKIGEDGAISLFEVQSVIYAKGREFGINSSRISADGIVEDLVADTISNPMLDSARKQHVVDNLQGIHTAGLCLRILSDLPGPLSRAIAEVSAGVDLPPETRRQLALKTTKEIEKRIPKPSPVLPVVSTTFGIIAALASLLSFAFGATSLRSFLSVYEDRPEVLGLTLGIASSVVAGLLTSLFHAKRSKARRKPRKDQGPEDANDHQQSAAPGKE